MREFLQRDVGLQRAPIAAHAARAPAADASQPTPAITSDGRLPLRVTPNDLLIIGIRNAKSGVQVGVNATLWTPDNGPHELNLSLTPATTRALQFFPLQLYHGSLVHVAATALAGSPIRGQTLVSLYVARPPASAFATKWFLGQDYLTSQDAIYFPGGRNTPGTEGPGALYSIGVTTPAAGADWSQTVPTGARWLVHGITGTLVTSATIATRFSTLVIDDGAAVLIQLFSNISQTNNGTTVYSWIAGVGFSTAAQGFGTASLPFPVSLLAGWRVRAATKNLQPGDQWSAIQFLVEESLED